MRCIPGMQVWLSVWQTSLSNATLTNRWLAEVCARPNSCRKQPAKFNIGSHQEHATNAEQRTLSLRTLYVPSWISHVRSLLHAADAVLKDWKISSQIRSETGKPASFLRLISAQQVLGKQSGRPKKWTTSTLERK